LGSFGRDGKLRLDMRLAEPVVVAWKVGVFRLTVPPDGAENPVIRVENLSKVYRSGEADLAIFADLDLRVARGERVAVVGESGAGKSTLLHLLGGLDRPSSGKIYFGQSDITALGDSQLAVFRNREIGFVWQTHYLLPEFTALENVMMPLLIRGLEHGTAARTSLEKLERVGLRNRASHQAGELSGGEQQRVVLARALAGDPKVLLADEPTGNLDFRTGDLIMDLIEDLHRSQNLTTVLVTHNFSYARRCHRILQLERGRLITTTQDMGDPSAHQAPSIAGAARRQPDPPQRGAGAPIVHERAAAGWSGSRRLMGEGNGFHYV
jgi:lipoprotein-releasing system ATP-binding protein